MLAARMAPPAELAATAAGEPASAPVREHEEAAGAAAGGMAAVTAFLKSKEGKQLEKQVMRGVFGLLKKQL